VLHTLIDLGHMALPTTTTTTTTSIHHHSLEEVEYGTGRFPLGVVKAVDGKLKNGGKIGRGEESTGTEDEVAMGHLEEGFDEGRVVGRGGGGGGVLSGGSGGALHVH